MINISHKIINLNDSDYHIHSSNFSDWLHTIDEIVQFAWKIWLKEVAITDHSQAVLDSFAKNKRFYCSWSRRIIKHWRNMYNDVKVIFWVEWDILDENWTCCFDIQGIESDFCILSAHKSIYSWDPSLITDATIKAIEKYHDKIKFIAHPCNNSDFGNYYDIEKLVEVANKYKIPLEFNAKNLLCGKTNIEKLHILLQKADVIYLNSDAHTLYHLYESRKYAIQFLKDNWYIASI